MAIYPVDARGLPIYRSSPQSMARIEATSELMASTTGGRVTRNNNDLTLGLVAAAEDSRGTYAMGFYANADPDNPRPWHLLDISGSMMPDPKARERSRKCLLVPERVHASAQCGAAGDSQIPPAPAAMLS